MGGRRLCEGLMSTAGSRQTCSCHGINEVWGKRPGAGGEEQQGKDVSTVLPRRTTIAFLLYTALNWEMIKERELYMFINV